MQIEDFTPGAVLRDLVVVQISDLHMSSIGRREKKILDLLDDLDPDVIFLTGDYVQWDGDYEAALEFLSRLQARIGIWAVMGDYDYSNSRKSCLFCHESGTGKPSNSHAVRFLRNSAELVRLPEGEIVIGGLDEKDLEQPTGPRPHILLSHSPLAFDALPGKPGSAGALRGHPRRPGATALPGLEPAGLREMRRIRSRPLSDGEETDVCQPGGGHQPVPGEDWTEAGVGGVAFRPPVRPQVFITVTIAL